MQRIQSSLNSSFSLEIKLKRLLRGLSTEHLNIIIEIFLNFSWGFAAWFWQEALYFYCESFLNIYFKRNIINYKFLNTSKSNSIKINPFINILTNILIKLHSKSIESNSKVP